MRRLFRIDWRGFGSTRNWLPQSVQSRRPWRPAGAFDIALDVEVSRTAVAIIADMNRAIWGTGEITEKQGLSMFLTGIEDDDSLWATE